MFDILEVCCILLEVLLDLGIEGVGRGDHLGGMVTDLSKVLQCLWGEGEEGMRECMRSKVFNTHSHTHTYLKNVCGRLGSLFLPPSLLLVV